MKGLMIPRSIRKSGLQLGIVPETASASYGSTPASFSITIWTSCRRRDGA